MNENKSSDWPMANSIQRILQPGGSNRGGKEKENGINVCKAILKNYTLFFSWQGRKKINEDQDIIFHLNHLSIPGSFGNHECKLLLKEINFEANFCVKSLKILMWQRWYHRQVCHCIIDENIFIPIRFISEKANTGGICDV